VVMGDGDDQWMVDDGWWVVAVDGDDGDGG